MNDHQKRIDYSSAIIELMSISRMYHASNPYHNFYHALGVFNAVNQLADMEKLDTFSIRWRFLLQSTALLQDYIFVADAFDNEEKSAYASSVILPKLGYNNRDIQMIGRLIIATKIAREPCNYLEVAIRDADNYNFGTDEFFKNNMFLMKEFNREDLLEWYEITLEFMNKHYYATEAARKLWGEKFFENKNKLSEMILKAKFGFQLD